ncbi:unnamed protein product [Diatraea saccharalis]|uniref:Uncharacterized protein n=1 Tax=Diatraea saccharalis TaxID=40085 RepID=A0A9N9R117_9NEOP|nr:unnamed protein product [Diatraea saccharalis]
MEENLVNDVIVLYKDKKWRDIVEKYHDHPERNKLLWVYPSENNFRFIKECLQQLGCDKIMSVGCGSGLLEWMITQATGVPVSGVEVDGAWWHCKYAPPTFIPLMMTTSKLEDDLISILRASNTTALLFCYFNNRDAFEDYLKYYSGKVLIIIGPKGKGVHTDPKPFGDLNDTWKLWKSQEVRSSMDYIAVYLKNIYNF